MFLSNLGLEPESETDVYFSQSQEHTSDHWFQFIQKCEARLLREGVRSRGCASGDYSLGRYASLRNEAFVPVRNSQQQWVEAMPSNELGWNAAGHPCPLDLPGLRSAGRWRSYRGCTLPVVVLLVVISVLALFGTEITV